MHYFCSLIIYSQVGRWHCHFILSLQSDYQAQAGHCGFPDLSFFFSYDSKAFLKIMLVILREFLDSVTTSRGL